MRVVVLLTIALTCGLATSATLLENKTEKDRLRPNCEAIREYVEIRDAAPGSAADQINSRIRRELTVGKKLRQEDCPEADSSEYFQYHNWAKVTSQRDGRLGIDYRVQFPGGTTRVKRWCDTYDLKTGHEIRLNRCLKSEAVDRIRQRACHEAKQNKDYYCGGAVTAMAYCWDNAGVRVLMPLRGDWRNLDVAEVLLPAAELKSLTLPDCAP